MRRLILAFGALALVTSVGLADTASPKLYTLDAKGKCHDSSGKFVATALCKTTPAPAPKHCHDPKTGRFIKCPA